MASWWIRCLAMRTATFWRNCSSVGSSPFTAGKRSALPAWTEFRFLTDLDLVWEFYIYGRRGRRLLPVEKELIRSILAAVRPEEQQR